MPIVDLVVVVLVVVASVDAVAGEGDGLVIACEGTTNK